MQVLALDSRIWFTGAPSAGGGASQGFPLWGDPPTTQKIDLSPPMPPSHGFDPKMPML